MNPNFRHRMNLPGVFAILFAIALPVLSSAQDRVRRFEEVKTDYSVIRDIDGQRRLVHNEVSRYPYFIMLDDSDGNQHVLSLPQNIRVRDFVVHDGSVYFCGTKRELSEGSEYAVVGWFELEGFPMVNVHYAQHNLLKSFERIGAYTIYADADEVHLAMIAMDFEGNHSLVDAHGIDLNRMLFDFPAYPTDFNSHFIDDLIVTDNYVVVASRTKSDFLTIGHLWCFLRPVTPGYSIFSVQSHHCNLGGTSLNKIVLESLGRTVFGINDYVVLHSGSKLDFGARFISRFDGIHHLASSTIGSPGDGFSFKDAKYNPNDRVLDIHAEVWSPKAGGPRHHKFFHVDMSTLNPIGIVPGRIIQYDSIFSHTYLRSRHQYEAVGYTLGESLLKVYKYTYNQWGGCMPREDTTIEPSDRNFYYKPVDCMSQYHYFWNREFEVDNDVFPIETICGNQ